MNEDATRLGYILPLFAALGWDTSNVHEVSPEEKVSRGFVDFAFRLSGTPRFFLETKRVSEDLNDPRRLRQTIPAECAAHDVIVQKVERMLSMQKLRQRAERDLDDARHSLSIEINRLADLF